MASLMRILAVSSLFFGCHAGVMNRQEMLDKYRHGHNQNWFRLSATPEAGRFPEYFYKEQKVDHFNSDDNRTFSQLYFANFEHYKPGGPILISIGGEGPAAAWNVRSVEALYARENGGGVLALEHRFYGKSQPFDSLATKYLQFLTSRQALHDLAQFQKWFIASNSSYAQSRFFCTGGSYPGNLAAWYRLEFPEMTAGCWSSSAPVHAQLDWPGFGEKVWRAVATDKAGVRDDSVSTKLFAGYEQAASLIQNPTPEAREKIIETFRVCPGTLVSQGDRDSFEMTVTGAVANIMQYNNSGTPKLEAIRDIVMKARTPLDAAFDVSRFLNLTLGDGEEDNCSDFGVDSMYKGLLNTSLSADGEGQGNAGRTWTWQTCNEFGFFQKATAEFEYPTMFTRAHSARGLWEQVCNDVFGIDDASIGANIAATNEYYGGKDPKGISHVLFSNGDLDAWSLLGITSYPANDREVYAEVAPLGSHCVGLSPPFEGDVPGSAVIRNKAFELFRKWGALESTEVMV